MTTKIENGIIDDSKTVDHNDDCIIHYSANDGFHIESIMVDGEDTDVSEYPDEYRFSQITKDHNITVICAEDKEPIIEKADPAQIIIHYLDSNGEKISNEDVIDTNVGEKYETTPKDITGYVLTTTPGNASGVAQVQKTDVKYVYEKQEYRITTRVDNGEIDKTQVVKYKDDCTIKYRANDGYKLKSILIDGKSVDIDKYPTAYKFSSVIEDHEIKVIYEEVAHATTVAKIVKNDTSATQKTESKTQEVGNVITTDTRKPLICGAIAVIALAGLMCVSRTKRQKEDMQ